MAKEPRLGVGLQRAEGIIRPPQVMCPRCNRVMAVTNRRTEEKKVGLLGQSTQKIDHYDFNCPDCGTNWSETVDQEPTGKCFIATAAYGSSLAVQVKSLRKFRDHELMNKHAGRCIVNLYYAISPPIARVIAKNEKLKRITRFLLIPFLHFAHSRA